MSPFPTWERASCLATDLKCPQPWAQQIEQQLTRDPEDLVARVKLIAYYFMNAIPHPRLEHIFWLIEHHPESELVFSYPATISTGDSPLSSQADYERAKALWLEQAARHPRDTAVMAHAAQFVQQSDPLDFATLNWPTSLL